MTTERPTVRELKSNSRASSAYSRIGNENALGFMFTRIDESEIDETLADVLRIDPYGPTDDNEPGYMALIKVDGLGHGYELRRIYLHGENLYSTPLAAFHSCLSNVRWRNKVACSEDGCEGKLRYAAPDLSEFGCADHVPDIYGDGDVYDLETSGPRPTESPA